MKLPIFDVSDSLIEGELQRNVWRVFPKSGDLVMDIGANKGGVSALCALNGAQVVAYEPNPIAFDFLLDTIKLNRIEDKVTPIHAAIYTRNGEVEISYNRIKNEEKRVNGRLLELGEYDDLKTTVMAVSLKDAIGNNEWNIVKMDIEGFEFPLILGCPDNVLNKIKYLTMELHYTFSPSKQDYDHFIAKLQAIFRIEGICASDGRLQNIFATRI
jgi:FkbM family methyltransferase